MFNSIHNTFVGSDKKLLTKTLFQFNCFVNKKENLKTKMKNIQSLLLVDRVVLNLLIIKKVKVHASLKNTLIL